MLFVLCLLLVAICAASAGCSRKVSSTGLIQEGQKLAAAGDISAAMLRFQEAVRVSPLDPNTHYHLGMADIVSGNGREAAEEFERAIHLDPEHWPAQSKLAELMATSADPAVLVDAHDRLKRLVQHLPDAPAVLTALAIVEWKLGEADSAERSLQQIVNKFPKQASAAVSLAKVLVSRGDIPGAERVLVRLVSEPGAPANLRIPLAEFYFAMGRLSDAERELKRATEAEPGNLKALLDLATIRGDLNRVEEAGRTYALLSSSAEARYRPLYGLFLLKTGKSSEAISEFERLLKRYPGDRGLRTILVSTYLSVGRQTDARRLLHAAVQSSNPDFDALFQNSIFDLESGSLDEAQAYIMGALRLRPEAAEAHYLQAAIHSRRGSVLSSMEELNESLTRNRSFLPARLELARYHIASNAPNVAWELLKQAPAEQQEEPDVVALKCWALLAIGDRIRFQSELTKALARQPSAELFLQNALDRLENRDFSAARSSAESLLKRDPSDARALLLLARSRFLEAGFDGAVSILRRYAETGPEKVSASRQLGELLVATGRIVGAQTVLRSVKQPVAGLAELALVETDLRAGDAADAEALVRQVLVADPQNTAARLLLGAAQQTQGKYADAAESYRSVLNANPSQVPALFNLAIVLADHLGKPEEALHLAEKARELAPESAAVDDMFGWVLHRRGMESLALIHLSDAVASGCLRAWYHLALVRHHAGDPAGARDAFQSGLRRTGETPLADATRRILQAAPTASRPDAGSIPDSVILSWSDLGTSERNLAERLDLYASGRACTSIENARAAVSDERKPARFTERTLLPLLLCQTKKESANDYFAALTSYLVTLPRAANLASAKTEWTDSGAGLRTLFAVSGVDSADLPGWDNTFVSWDFERKGPLPEEIEYSTLGIYEYNLRSLQTSQDPGSWQVFNSIWPKGS